MAMARARAPSLGPARLSLAEAQSVPLRYAFSPLLDEESEEEEKEPMMNEAFGQKTLPPLFLVSPFCFDGLWSLMVFDVALCLQRG